LIELPTKRTTATKKKAFFILVSFRACRAVALREGGCFVGNCLLNSDMNGRIDSRFASTFLARENNATVRGRRYKTGRIPVVIVGAVIIFPAPMPVAS